MTQRYSTGIRFNHSFGNLESLSFVGEGVGGFLFIGGVLTDRPFLSILGLIFVIGAVVALLKHLGKPMRSWRAITKIRTSPVSRGTASIGAFLAFAIGSFVVGYIPPLAFLETPLTILACVFAFLIVIYAGMLLRSMRSISLWRGPYVPLCFIAQSLATAAMLMIGVAPWMGADFPSAATLGWVAVAALLASAVFGLLHLATAKRSEAVKASLSRLQAGDLRSQFVWGGWLAGIIVPLVIVAGVLVAGSEGGGGLFALMAGVAALLRLYGDYAYRASIVVAGAYEPFQPVDIASAGQGSPAWGS